MKRFNVIFLTAILILSLAAVACNNTTNSDPGNQFPPTGPNKNGSYNISVVDLVTYGGAEREGDTLTFTGWGGAYFLFRTTNFDINDYSSLVINYSGSNVAPGAQLTHKAIKDDFDPYSGGGNYGTDLDWKNVSTGTNTFTVSGSDFETFTETGYIGFALERNGGDSVVKIVSITLMPKGDGSELVLTAWDDIVFTGWGGLGSASNDVTFDMVAGAAYECRATYTIPAEGKVFTNISITFTLTKLATGEPANDMKISIQDREKDDWSNPTPPIPSDYKDYTSDGTYTYTQLVSWFSTGFVTIAHNVYGDETSDFNITITEIKFHN